MIFSHGILFNNYPGKVISYKADVNGLWIVLVIKIEDAFFIPCNLSGYNSISQNKDLLPTICIVIEEMRTLYSAGNIIVGGDFNMMNGEIDAHQGMIHITLTAQLWTFVTH